ncbi:MAG: flavodoxin-dependent (E)-4-hydroxy-3-methylbut-2-enyl-diphosphate synthase [Bacteroidales bacterium]|nr:flavodoxin-dependent (E)-4-hydroxy-3-methylbut-2-enyl-diphosphate synthase [Bacteroidales bacterium]
MEAAGKNFAVVLNPLFNENSYEELQVKAPALLGRFLAGRQADGISVTNNGDIPAGSINRLCFSILQCTGLRITRTVYISCPTCGRTKFNLQEAVKKVKEKTSHFRGLKIAVMGCIVNGPGEMAGADWGYVGAAPGKVHIYKGSEPVLKNVEESVAASELLRLIEEDQASR